MLPAKVVEINRLLPPVGVMGWFTVLYVNEGTMRLVRIPCRALGPTMPLKLM
jgi:hypothetical protein